VTSNPRYSDNVSFSLASTGSAGTFSKTVYIWFKDAAGNVSSYSSDAINLINNDTTAPASPSISINSGADNTTSTNVTLSLSATDAAGVTGYYASESSTTPANNTSGWVNVSSSNNYSAAADFSLSSATALGSNSRKVYVWFKDQAGNVSSSASDNISYFFENTVTVTLNNLEWQIASASDEMNWYSAVSYCSDLDLGFQQDWRLPRSVELYALFDSSASGMNTPKIVPELRETTFNNKYWSSTAPDGSGGNVWYVDFNNMNWNLQGKTFTEYVRCVRDSSLGTKTLITAGGNHTCVLFSGGAIKCWGQGDKGRLGNASDSDQRIPILVSDISNATSVSAFGEATCAIISGGSVKCWGRGQTGTMGNGSTDNQMTPVSVSGISNATSLAGGSHHTCVLISGGSIKCWGSGYYGQMGNGSTPENQLTPVSVNNINNATAVSGSNVSVCALLSDGTVNCWGRGYEGTLGNGRTTNRSEPVAVSGLSSVTQISAGYHRVCALLSD
jgi:hypothetical protein